MLEGLTPPKRNTPCATRKLLESLSPEDAEILRKALADTTAWPAKTLYRSLYERGLLLSDTSINSHRKGMCSC